MNFPLTFSDITLWLAITATIVLITSELLHSSPKTSARIPINLKLLRMIGIGLGLAFIAAVIVRVSQTA